jgi:hypothetical protein
MKFGVTVRNTKKVIEKKRRLGSNLTLGGRLRVNDAVSFCNYMALVTDE